MPEKLQLLALDMLLPEEGKTPPAFMALGKHPGEAVIAWILYSRNQIKKVLQENGELLDADIAQKIMIAADNVNDLPVDSDLDIQTLEGKEAQKAFNNAHPAPLFKPVTVHTDITGQMRVGDDEWDD